MGKHIFIAGEPNQAQAGVAVGGIIGSACQQGHDAHGGGLANGGRFVTLVHFIQGRKIGESAGGSGAHQGAGITARQLIQQGRVITEVQLLNGFETNIGVGVLPAGFQKSAKHNKVPNTSARNTLHACMRVNETPLAEN